MFVKVVTITTLKQEEKCDKIKLIFECAVSVLPICWQK